MAQADQEFDYLLDEQVGFLLRQVNQRHLSIFTNSIKDLTPTQFATLAKMREIGAVSQNDLGRQTAMDAATMKGVVDRLSKRGLVCTKPDPSDQRRILVELEPLAYSLLDEMLERAHKISDETLAPLKKAEQKQLINLLKKVLDR
ncbi:MAG: MarR family transcriptional regulator [Hyphomicrobiales bacterium]